MAPPAGPDQRPLLIYDGDCAFCRYCVEYARAATGVSVDYRPFQQVQGDYPHISEDEFRAAIQLVLPDGAVSSGAKAAFQTLALGGYNRAWYVLYTSLPLFAALSEWAYQRVAGHRGACYRLSRVLFGPTLLPARMQLTTWLFLRLLALVYLAAFASFAVQWPGLVGGDGILPAADYFAAIDGIYGVEKYWMVPSLLWLGDSDAVLGALAWAGILFSLLLLSDRLARLCLPLLYLAYLSLFYSGQVFMSYQWDILLLECGFLAIFLPWAPRLFAWLYRWLLFRFLLQSGLVKLMSGDATWWGLTALDYHFETQPLPTALAWYAHQLPARLLQAGVVFTFVVELLVPFLILMPRRPRQLAAALIALFELAIFATGNYNFFNLLTMCLCVLLLDDPLLGRIVPGVLRRRAGEPGTGGSRVGRGLLAAVATVYLLQGGIMLYAMGSHGRLPDTVRRLLVWNAPFHMVGSYGLFAVMTTNRPEIIIEGSNDGREWLAYELPYKPGALDRAPVWAAPHQPRLDWQLWFAALAPRERNPWLKGLVAGLLRGSKPVLALFEYNPFPDNPPRYLRASLYRYRFTRPDARAASGAWWTREYLGMFWPPTARGLPVEKESVEQGDRAFLSEGEQQ